MSLRKLLFARLKLMGMGVALMLDQRELPDPRIGLGSKLLIGSFQPRRDVYGVAIGSVVEEATEIADDRAFLE